jgi:ABC-2 type transport system permease protein
VLLQQPVTWTAMIEGAAVSVTYGLILFAFAFRHFRNKDIVS